VLNSFVNITLLKRGGMNVTIGEKLKQLRGEKSLDEIAAALGISKQAVSNYENDTRIPRDEIKLKIARYFEKTVEEIFFTE
jgi:toxin-antitoxin system, antitoxin component, xre family